MMRKPMEMPVVVPRLPDWVETAVDAADARAAQAQQQCAVLYAKCDELQAKLAAARAEASALKAIAKARPAPTPPTAKPDGWLMTPHYDGAGIMTSVKLIRHD